MRQDKVVIWQAGWLLALVILALVVSACQPAASNSQSAAPTQAVPVTGDTPVPTKAAPTTAAAMPTEAAKPTAAPTTAAQSGSEDYGKSGGSTAASNEVKLTVREDPKLGKYLADEKGMTLYLYTKDPLGKSVCEGGCLKNWPALLVAKGGKVEIEGVDKDNRLGTVTRSDGSTQVAYNGYPLYYWIKDTKAGDVTGQGVGNVWFIVPPQQNVAASSGGNTAGSASNANAPSEVKLTVREDPKLGKFFADEKGMSLYLYTKDVPGVSVCEGGCLKNWPALLVAKDGKVEIDGMDEDSNLGTITRSDGSTQVAYKGMALYYWIKDTKPGDVTGQGVGNVWFVVPPDPAKSANAASASGSTSANSGSTAAASSQVKLTVRDDAKLGKFLADEKGMTLYLYTKDTPGKSVCEGKCLANWPALLVAKDGKVEVEGMDASSKLGTTTRSDGSTQVTYNGMPLYYWVKDAKPGDVTGQGVGGVWFVVAP